MNRIIIAGVKDFSSHQASRMIVELLERVSDERLVQLTCLGEKLTSDDEVLRAIRGVRNLLLDATHPAKKIFARFLNIFLPGTGRLSSTPFSTMAGS